MPDLAPDFDFRAFPSCRVGFSSGEGSFLVESHLAQDLAEIVERGGQILGRFAGFSSFVPLDPDKVRKGLLPRRTFAESRGRR